MLRNEFIERIEKHLGKRSWEIARIAQGNTSPNRLRLISGENDFFVKEIKENEKNVLKTISLLNLKHVEKILYPELLEENILITQFIEAGHIQNMDIEPGLIENMAEIQNYYYQNNLQKRPNRSDRTGWGDFLEGHRTRSRDRLIELEDKYSKVISEYKKIFNFLEDRFDTIKSAYLNMPFRLLHNDFREGNILASSPQIIVDWGSCYGSGPMLIDIAPFVLHNPKLLDCYRKKIVGFEQHTDDEFQKWTSICGTARFYAFLTYIKAFSQSDGIEKTLKQKYPVWEKLIDKDFLN